MKHSKEAYRALADELFGDDIKNSPDGRIQIDVGRIYTAVLDARAERNRFRHLVMCGTKDCAECYKIRNG